MTENEAIIRNLFSRIHDVHRTFGTITDKKAIHEAFKRSPDLFAPHITEPDVINFRRVVETGAMKDNLFRPPKGYKVLAFLIELRSFQERRYKMVVQEQENELVSIIANHLFLIFARNNGDMVASKKEMLDRFDAGLGGVDSASRVLFNKAYKVAKLKWDTHTNPQ